MDKAHRCMDRAAPGRLPTPPGPGREAVAPSVTPGAAATAVADTPPPRTARTAGTTPVADAELSDRELDVLRMLGGTLPLSGIASELFVSHNTIKTHCKAIYRKLGVSSREEAVALARERDLTRRPG